jgi:hypothetical protein
MRKIFFHNFFGNLNFSAVDRLILFLHTLPFLIFEWPFEEVERVSLEFHPAK